MRTSHNNESTRLPYLKGLLWLIAASILTWAFIPLEFHQVAKYAVVHASLEIFAVVVASILFAVIWYSPRQAANMQLAAALFLGVAILDCFHLLSYVGMPDLGSPNSPHKAIIFWLAARYLSVGAILAMTRPDLKLHSFSKSQLLTGIIIFTSAFGYVGAFHESWFPQTFISGVGLTPIKIVLEYTLIAVFLLLALSLYRRADTRDSSLYSGILIALLTLSVSEFLFTLYGNVADFANLCGHIFKVFAYWIILKTVFVSIVKKPYLELKHSGNLLRSFSDILSIKKGSGLSLSVAELLYKQLGAEHILISTNYFDSNTSIYLHEGKLQNEPSGGFLDSLPCGDYKELETCSKTPKLHQCPAQLNSSAYLCQPLRSTEKGFLGNIAIAHPNELVIDDTLQDILSLTAIKLTSEIENALHECEIEAEKVKTAKSLEFAREQERQHLARDIHDELGGSLAALKIDISLLSRRLEKQGAATEHQEKLTAMGSVVDNAIRDMRQIINKLRLGILDDLGLVEALEWKLKDIENRQGISTRLELNCAKENLGIENENARVSLYRLINEALTNISKHANASAAVVRVNENELGMCIEIIDNGSGLGQDTQNKDNSYGIMGMKERAVQLGGVLRIESLPAGGTKVQIDLPQTGT